MLSCKFQRLSILHGLQYTPRVIIFLIFIFESMLNNETFLEGIFLISEFLYQLLMPLVDIMAPSTANKLLSTITSRVPINTPKHFRIWCPWSLQELLKKLERFLIILYTNYFSSINTESHIFSLFQFISFQYNLFLNNNKLAI